MRCKRNKKNWDLNRSAEILHHLLYTKEVLLKCYVRGKGVSTMEIEFEIGEAEFHMTGYNIPIWYNILLHLWS